MLAFARSRVFPWFVVGYEYAPQQWRCLWAAYHGPKRVDMFRFRSWGQLLPYGDKKMINIVRNVDFSQWNGCRFFIQIGSTAITFGRTGKAAGIEILTPSRWFALRPFKRLTLRRV